MRTATSLLALTLLAAPVAAQAPTPPNTTTVVKTNKATSPVEERWPDPPKPRVAGDPRIRLMPPLEFDHSYTGSGKLIVIHAATQDEVRKLCPGTTFPKAGAYGCAITHAGGCTVVTASEADMKAVGLTMDITMRHETAHCNGWPGDHRGALPIEDWALDWERSQ